jgi:hypothetical protein
MHNIDVAIAAVPSTSSSGSLVKLAGGRLAMDRYFAGRKPPPMRALASFCTALSNSSLP